MLTLFRKLLGKPQPQQPKAITSSSTQKDATPAMPTVEVAHLSLAAIVARLPEELQALVRQQPDASTTVALPLPTIVKQLPSGAVKISLATLHRQAPAGVFAPLTPGDKRMVSVPLAEVFRHVNPFTLKRRMDQRSIQLPSSDFNLFGSTTNPYAITGPDEDEPTTLVIDESPEPAVEPRFSPEPPAAGTSSRGIAPPADYFAPSPHRVTPTAHAVPPQPAPPKSNLPPLRLPLAPLAATWPDEIKSELAALNGSASALLPVDDVSAGLAKGKVIFTWGQMQACIEPALESTSSVDESTPLTLPLKVVAPAFLAASKQPKPDARKVTVAADIPAIFSDSRAPAVPEPPAEMEPVVDEVVEVAPVSEIILEAEAAPTEPLAFQLVVDAAPVEEPAVEPVAESVPVVEEAPVSDETLPVEASTIAEDAPVIEEAPTEAGPPVIEEAPSADVTFADEPASEPPAALELEPSQPIELESAADEALPHSPAPTEEGAPVSGGRSASSLGEIFGEPDRDHWTPADIVSRVPQLPGVAGAVVALQEGLLVAQSLPEDVKGDVIAAFLPQMFARLNQYAGEMNFGEVDDLLFTTRGAPCQIYRLGFVYFAVLGKPGESLPWQQLRLLAEELAKQTQPS